MAAGVPPPPLNSPSGSYYWLEWYTNLTNFLNGTNIPWSNINFTSADIADIPSRKHNELTSIQGGNPSGTKAGTGNAYHLIGYGASDATATNISVPPGWTIVHSGTGVYTVTHNLGLVSPNYMAGACSNNTAAIVIAVDTSLTNSIVVYTASKTGLGTALDAAFSFWIGKL